jgi:transcriptional regulator with XRE-family HTH domain
MSKQQRPGLADLGDQVSGWRRARGLTQADLESRAGLAHNALSRIETGQVSPRLASLEKIANALGLTTEELQFRKPPAEMAGDKDPGVEALAVRLASLDDAQREAVLAAFHTLLDQMGSD